MAEENAFLDYNDGFVLHNGLPVKWIANSADLYNDYDLIIEQTNPSYAYDGLSIPSKYHVRYPTTAWIDTYIHTEYSEKTWFQAPYAAIQAAQNASAGWGTATAMIDGEMKINSYNKTCSSYSYSNTPVSTVRTVDPKLPCESSGTKTTFVIYDSHGDRCNVDAYWYSSASLKGFIYPKGKDHFFIGIKFGNNYGVPTNPDLTNNGNKASESCIHKIYAPNASSFLGMINASNYTAVNNVYAPNVTDLRMGLNGSADGYGQPSVYCRKFENWYVPRGTFGYGATKNQTSWNGNRFVDNTSAVGITANEVDALNLSQFEDVSAQNIRASGYKDSTVAKDITAASAWFSSFSGFDNVNVSDNLIILNSKNVNNFTVNRFTASNVDNISNVSSHYLNLAGVNAVSNVTADILNVQIIGVKNYDNTVFADMNASALQSCQSIKNFTGSCVNYATGEHSFRISGSIENANINLTLPTESLGTYNYIRLSSDSIDGLNLIVNSAVGVNVYTISGSNSAHNILISGRRDRATFYGYSSITDVTAATMYVPTSAYTSGLSGDVHYI